MAACAACVFRGCFESPRFFRRFSLLVHRARTYNVGVGAGVGAGTGAGAGIRCWCWLLFPCYVAPAAKLSIKFV